ncbi:hypothetical protein [Streptomyces sp. uw30]|nr:hypothetical protein [Streptomyces sp. uw30]
MPPFCQGGDRAARHHTIGAASVPVNFEERLVDLAGRTSTTPPR